MLKGEVTPSGERVQFVLVSIRINLVICIRIRNRRNHQDGLHTQRPLLYSVSPEQQA